MAWLMTGGMGYVGEHLYRTMPEEMKLECLRPGRQELRLNSWESVRQFFEEHEVEQVIQLAAALDNDPNDLFESNIIGLYYLLQVVKEKHIKYFIMISGNNVYGERGAPFSEEDTYGPVPNNYYGISKMFGELAVRELLSGTDTQYAIVRIGDIYGPKQKTGALLKAVVGNILEGQPQKLYGEGERIRDYIYIDDVAEGLCFVFRNRLQGIYNLATGQGTSVREIVAIAEAISPSKEKTVHVQVDHEDRSCVVLDVRKLKEAGYSARITVEEGLKKIIAEEKT